MVVIYSFVRLLFLAFQWESFSDVGFLPFLGGIRFDLSTIFYTNSLLIIGHTVPGNFKYTRAYQKGLKLLFYLVNVVFISTNFVDFIYYSFTGKRSTFGLITASGMQHEIAGLLPSFIKQYWYILFILVTFIYLFWKFIPKQQFSKITKVSRVAIFKQLGMFLVASACVILIGRGGFQRKPIRRVDAMNYASSKNTPIVLNTPFCILKTFKKNKELKTLNYFSDKELKAYYSPIKHYKDSLNFDKKNIVIIILESFGDENVSYSSPETGNTPFLDSLIQKSLYFKNGFANGRVSIDAVPSVISGVPSIFNEPYISSSYAFNEVSSLPEILKNEGYYTSFFHGAFNGSQNFDQYAKIAGFDSYFGKNEYPDDNPDHQDGKWGIFDEEFLQFFGEELTEFKEPFFSSIFTLSSHIPFVMPKKHRGRFKKGNTQFYETVGYTDYALRKFFNYSRQQSWYKNTLFVITADHCSDAEKGFFKSTIQKYSIPIMFFDPSNEKLAGKQEKNVQQIDILPSILDYLHYDKKFVSFGNSFKDHKNLVINYINNAYHVIIDDYYIVFNNNKIVELYNCKDDILLSKNILKRETVLVKGLEVKIKSYLQSFNTSFINNTLLIK